MATTSFSSLANDLTTNDQDGTDFASKDVFERNLATSTTQLVSINATGTNSGDDTSDMPNQTLVNASQQSAGTISSDGRYVMFESLATDLVPNFVQQNGGAPYGYDLYLRDTVAGTTTLLSHDISADANGGNGISAAATMTPDGSYVVFQSTSSNLVAHDTNDGINQTDVFISTVVPTAAFTVTGVSPSSGPAKGGTKVIIMGEDFTGATDVDFGQSPAAQFKVVSSTEIMATSPAGMNAGVVDVTVTTASGTSAVNRPADEFSYAPEVTKLSTASGPLAGGTTVTITGTNLLQAEKVFFGSVAGKIIKDTATKIVVKSPLSTSAGPVNVTVTSAGGTSASLEFTYVAAPTVTSISPTSGPTGGGTPLTITGMNFTGATAVDFGKTKVTNFTVSADGTQITVTTPKGKTGTVFVTVVTAGGTSAIVAGDKFTYTAAGGKVTPTGNAKMSSPSSAVISASPAAAPSLGAASNGGPANDAALWALLLDDSGKA